MDGQAFQMWKVDQSNPHIHNLAADGELHQINGLWKNSKGLGSIFMRSNVKGGQQRPVELSCKIVMKHNVR